MRQRRDWKRFVRPEHRRNPRFNRFAAVASRDASLGGHGTHVSHGQREWRCTGGCFVQLIDGPLELFPSSQRIAVQLFGEIDALQVVLNLKVG